METQYKSRAYGSISLFFRKMLQDAHDTIEGQVRIVVLHMDEG